MPSLLTYLGEETNSGPDNAAGGDFVRLIIDVDDADQEFIRKAAGTGGTARLSSRGEAKDVIIIGTADPISVAGSGDRYKALYDITLLCE